MGIPWLTCTERHLGQAACLQLFTLTNSSIMLQGLLYDETASAFVCDGSEVEQVGEEGLRFEGVGPWTSEAA